MDDLLIVGDALHGFEPIADVFAREAARQMRGGSALCVIHNGKVVVDLRSGTHAEHGGRQLLFSVSKLVTTAVCVRLEEEGMIDFDEPLSAHWPELNRSSTRRITPRMVLGHRSGLVGSPIDLSIDELVNDGLERILGSQAEPAWEPDTDHGYHAWSFGALLQGLLRRSVGAGVDELLDPRVNKLLGSALQLGVPGSSDGVASLDVDGLRPTPLQSAWTKNPERRADALASGSLRDIRVFNQARIMEAPWPASNMIGTAHDVALVVNGLISGSLVSTDAMTALRSTRSRGRDRVLGVESHYGLGVQLPSPQIPFLGTGSFGHEGGGGCLAVGSPELGLSIGFTTTSLVGVKGASSAALALVPAIRHCAENVK